MSELEPREVQPDPMALVEYQIVRMTGTLLLSFMSTLDQAVMWLPVPGTEISGACAGRYRLLPGGPWIVHTCYPERIPWPAGRMAGGNATARRYARSPGCCRYRWIASTVSTAGASHR